ncbi:MAG: phosphoribosylglycinamide formyltransferase [Luteolibacter sp.]|jgi:phosphoribosylglycinamide formyltransferase 1
MKSITLGILGSGSGSNFQALLDAIDDGRLDAEIAVVLSDNPQARILERARARGIRTEIMNCIGHKTLFPEAEQARVAALLRDAGVGFVCLAGFMRLVKPPLLDAFPGRILNIHPSLLPAFPGLEAWKQAIDAGVRETGCTVHLVDAGMDTGPIVMQERVRVSPEDTPETLHARIQQAEHRLYPAAVSLLARSQN